MTPRYFRGTVNWHFELERRIPKAAFYFACALLPYYYPELVTDLGLKDGEGADEVKVDCSGVVKILQETGIADLSEPVFAIWPRMLTDTRAALRVLFAQHCEGADDFFDGDELCNVAQSKSNGEVDTFQVAPSLSPTSPGQGSQRKKRVPLVHHCVKVGSDKELGKALRNDWTEGRSSWKPFRILQVVIENPTRPEFSSTRLVMVVNHAVGDANAMTPLLKTFIQLTRGFESMVSFLEDGGAASKFFKGVMRAALPKLPVVSTLHTVEDRLRKGLFLDHVRHGKQIARSDCASTFWGGPLTFRNVADGFLLTLEQTAMVLMRRLSKDLRIPLDHIICALAGLADEGARGAPVPDPKLEAITNVGVSEITDAGGAGTTTSAQTTMTARKVPSDEWKATPHPQQQGDHAAWYVRVDEYTPHAITTDSFAEMKANYYVQPGGVPPVPKEALKRGVLPYRILVPNRDGPHEEELLANVVVDRTFEINMRNQTYFGAVHELSSKLRNREWHAPAATDPWAHQRIGMNIRPAVRDVFPGVKQQLEWQKTMPGVNPRRRYSEQPLDAFVDEHNTGEWTYQFAINPECAAQGFTLAVHFFEILQKLSEAPLDPIIFENSP
eukprot:g19142.t1